MLIMKHSRWTPNLEKSLDLGSETICTIVYYCLHIILFEPNLIIRLRFDVHPTTEIYIIFLHIRVGNETPTQSQVKLIVKIRLTAHW